MLEAAATKPCSVPVAFIVFNRPELTARVFGAIRRARPRQLFVIADGPRHAGEKDLCERTRAVVSAIDWKCELHTDFSNVNLGCGHRIPSGLDWVFSRVEEAIILEDDCVPAPSFFPYCAELLSYYADDGRVMHLSGNNFLAETRHGPESYYFSKYTFNWGWATWRRAWQHYDFTVSTWPKFKASGLLSQLCPDPVEARYWRSKLDPFYERKRDDTWDYQWNYAVWVQGGVAILPARNLVSNEGFGLDATHTRGPDLRARLPVEDIWTIKHQAAVTRDELKDQLAFELVLGGGRLRQRATWRYRLSKPARLWRKWRGR